MSKTIRDAVHGDILLGPLEIELIDTPEFQRLRGIRQLGTAALVFPSAVHTRFEHSLGTSWMSRLLVDAIRRTVPVSADDETIIRVAALLHDITHIPFGHTLEDERRVLPRHDKDRDRLDHFLQRSGLTRILDREGIRNTVIDTLEQRRGLASDIVGGPVSADLLDYLRRDNYFCGLSQQYDLRVLASFTSIDGHLAINLEKNGQLRRDALSELVNLLRIRYVLSERVYFHHTKIAAGAMISKAVELALSRGLQPAELRSLSDETLVYTLAERFGGDPAIRHLVDSLRSRQLYRACVVLSADAAGARRRELVDTFHFDAGARDRAERLIAAECGIEPHHLILYCPSYGMSLPEAGVRVRLPGGDVVALSESNNDEIRVLQQKHRDLWKFYVLIDRRIWERRDRIHQVADLYLTSESGWPSSRVPR